ncbi:hypothetical protein BJ741DRAFT_603639 [Chytriomyces cf. hyalinus JEL632]|nr:hypothetical protein BJ741DRAFT_603639 [Chytriomyces cf. hyalinus JEL632]
MVYDLSYALAGSGAVASYYFPFDRRFMPAPSREPYPNFDHTLNVATLFDGAVSVQDMLDKMSSTAKAWTTNSTVLYLIAEPVIGVLPGVVNSGQYNQLCGFVNSLAPNTCKTKAYNPRPPLSLVMNYTLIYPYGPLTMEWSFSDSNATVTGTVTTSAATATLVATATPGSTDTGTIAPTSPITVNAQSTVNAKSSDAVKIKRRQVVPKVEKLFEVLLRRGGTRWSPLAQATLSYQFAVTSGVIPRDTDFETNHLAPAINRFSASNPTAASLLGTGRMLEAAQFSSLNNPSTTSEFLSKFLSTPGLKISSPQTADFSALKAMIAGGNPSDVAAARDIIEESAVEGLAATLSDQQELLEIPGFDAKAMMAEYKRQRALKIPKLIKMVGGGDAQVGAFVVDQAIGYVAGKALEANGLPSELTVFIPSVGVPEPPLITVFKSVLSFQAASADVFPDGVDTEGRAGPLIDSISSKGLSGKVTEDIKNYISKNSDKGLSFPDADTFTAADLLNHVAKLFRGPGTSDGAALNTVQELVLDELCDIAFEAVEVDADLTSDGTNNLGMKELSTAGEALNSLGRPNGKKTKRSGRFNTVKNNQRTRGTGLRAVRK